MELLDLEYPVQESLNILCDLEKKSSTYELSKQQ